MSALICTPTRGSQFHFDYMVGMMKINGAYGGWMPLKGQSDIYVARNTLANQFLNSTKHDTLVFIDSDIGFERADWLELLGTDAPLVSGMYPGKGEGPDEWIFRNEQYETVDPASVPKSGILKVGLVPCGFLKIERKVLEALIDTGLAPAYAGGKMHQFFNGKIVNDWLFSEDYSFSVLATEAGFQPVVNCAISLAHDGHKMR